MLSTTCRYGMLAVLYLAACDRSCGLTPIRRISDALGISHSFLTKVLQQLQGAGLVRSRRGPNGGVALRRPPDRLSLKEVIVAVDGPAYFTECVLGLPGCGRATPCPLHDQWEAVRGALDDTFRTTTVADAVSDRAVQPLLRTWRRTAAGPLSENASSS